jgi:hypothetical protein
LEEGVQEFYCFNVVGDELSTDSEKKSIHGLNGEICIELSLVINSYAISIQAKDVIEFLFS